MFTTQATDFILNIFHCCCAIFIKVGGFVKSNRKASTKNRKRKRSSCGRRAAAAGPSHFLYIRPFAQTLSLSLSFSFSLSHFFHSSISHLISLFCLLFTLSLSPSLYSFSHSLSLLYFTQQREHIRLQSFLDFHCLSQTTFCILELGTSPQFGVSSRPICA